LLVYVFKIFKKLVDCAFEIAVSLKHFVDVYLFLTGLVFIRVGLFDSSNFELCRSLENGGLGFGGSVLGMSLLSLVAHYFWYLSVKVIEALVFLGFQFFNFVK